MEPYEIRTVTAREILDCRLEPTLRVHVTTTDGTTGRADVPAGRSTGSHEAVEVRDGGDRYRGRGVRNAVANVEEQLGPAVTGVDVRDQRAVDAAIRDACDHTRKADIGGNATTGVSLAALKAGASATDTPLFRWVGGSGVGTLPVPLLDLVEGGELAATDLAFQEHQVLPVGADTFAEAIQLGAEVYYELGDRLAASYGRQARNVGVEGGYTPAGMDDPRDALDACWAAVKELGYQDRFALGLDVAATHFYDPDTGGYRLMGESVDRGELHEFYVDLCETYPLVTIEDPFEEDDFAAFAELAVAVDAQIVGDDLFVTNPERVSRGVDAGAADALLLKVNQVGTVTEALEAARTARRGGLAVQVSERSGQTPDTWLADLAVGLDTGQVKTGVTRGERTEQYNRLLEIEDRLGDAATYGGTLPTP
jgi:enolase